MCAHLKTDLPALVDTMRNEVSDAYAAFPERLYVIDTTGRVAYKGGRGPVGFEPQELDQVLLLTLLDGHPPRDVPLRGKSTAAGATVKGPPARLNHKD